MKDVQILEYCDYCWSDGEKRTPAVEGFIVGIGPAERTGRPSMAGLLTCELHAKVLRDLQDLVTEYGEPLRGAPVQPSLYEPAPTVACPICNKGMTSAGRIGHIYSVHIGQPRGPMPQRCPSCSWKPAQGSGNPAVAVGKHRVAAHDYDPLAEALAAYRASR